MAKPAWLHSGQSMVDTPAKVAPSPLSKLTALAAVAMWPQKVPPAPLSIKPPA